MRGGGEEEEHRRHSREPTAAPGARPSTKPTRSAAAATAARVRGAPRPAGARGHTLRNPAAVARRGARVWRPLRRPATAAAGGGDRGGGAGTRVVQEGQPGSRQLGRDRRRRARANHERARAGVVLAARTRAHGCRSGSSRRRGRRVPTRRIIGGMGLCWGGGTAMGLRPHEKDHLRASLLDPLFE